MSSKVWRLTHSGAKRENVYSRQLVLSPFLCFPQQHQRVTSLNDVVRLDQQFLNSGSFHFLVRLDGNFELHCFQNGNDLLDLDGGALFDFDFPNVGVERRLDGNDVRVWKIPSVTIFASLSS